MLNIKMLRITGTGIYNDIECKHTQCITDQD